jgi:hypothetical protein
MTDNSGADNSGGPKKFVLKQPNTTADAKQAHGAQMIETKTVHDMKLRFKYFIEERNADPVNNISLHKATILLMMKEEPTIQVVPNDDTIEPYSDMRYFPTDKKSFETQFAESSKIVSGTSKRITLCHAITASRTLADLKWNSQHLLPYLKLKKITIVGDKFSQVTIASIGYFINIAPQWVHRETFAAELHELIEANVDFTNPHFRQFTESHDTDDDNDISDDHDDDMEEGAIPSFEFTTTTVRFGSGNEQMATKALDVLGSRQDAAFLKEIFCSLDFTTLIGCTFIPRGLIQMTSTQTLRHFIGQQNAYLHRIECVSIFGLSIAAAKAPVLMDTEAGADQSVPVIKAITKALGILAVYQTNFTATQGKWLVIYQKTYDLQVKKFLDEELPVLYQCLPEAFRRTNQIEDYEYPRRPGIIRQHGYTVSYARALQNVISEETSGPTAPPRGKRAPAQIVYQDVDYGPPANKKNNTGYTTSRSTVSNLGPAPPAPPVGMVSRQDITNMIETSISQKISEVVHQTDQKIKAAVDPINTKIDRIDATLNNNFAALTTTINQNITDTITEMFQSINMQSHAGLITPPSNLAPVSTSNRYAALSSSSYKSPSTTGTNHC